MIGNMDLAFPACELQVMLTFLSLKIHTHLLGCASS